MVLFTGLVKDNSKGHKENKEKVRLIAGETPSVDSYWLKGLIRIS